MEKGSALLKQRTDERHVEIIARSNERRRETRSEEQIAAGFDGENEGAGGDDPRMRVYPRTR